MADEEIAAAAAAADTEAAEQAASHVISENKRKHVELDSVEASKPDLSNPYPAEAPSELKAARADSNGVESPAANAEENAVELYDAPEAKRPRLDADIADSAANAGQQEEYSTDGAQVENSNEHPSTEHTLQPAAGDSYQATSTDEIIKQPDSEPTQQAELVTSNTQQPATGETEGVDPPMSYVQPLALGDPHQSDAPTNNTEQPASVVIQQGSSQLVSCKIEVPNNKVGVLIGKAGDTIRFLQYNSGARIQITRDADADPYSSTRPVELIGTAESINKAEQLIKDVIAEADAGGSPSLVARGFGTAQTGAEQIQIQVPYEKVGLIIGKGGETIKNLQTKSGARIQVILQNIPEGDASKERTVRVTGNKNQIDAAREMIKEVLSQNPIRPSPLSGGFSQPAYRPRGPAGPPPWGPRTAPPTQHANYCYQQGGAYPSQTPQYPAQTYGGYPQQQAPRGNFNTGWENRSSASAQVPSHGGGYDHYQGNHVTDGSAPAAHMPNPSAAAPTSTHPTGPVPAQANYNYGQPQGYGQPNPYPQSVPPQQSYGHGYDDSKYENQAATQHAYGGHGNPQAGAYPQQVSAEAVYAQQPYGKPAYGMQPQGPPSQSYGPPPRASQPDATYQGHVPSAQAYGPQQSYPYPSSGQMQQSYPYGPTPATNDGYSRPTSVPAPAPGYAPQGGPVAPAYVQQGGQVAAGYPQPGQPTPAYAPQGGQQPAPTYAQGVPPGGYGSYPSSQAGYGDQSAQNNANYGYQGSADAGYVNIPGQAYGAAGAGQAGYAQPALNQPTYDQSMAPQTSYGAPAGAAPVNYAKSISPQPQAGYNQYESGQMYGHH